MRFTCSLNEKLLNIRNSTDFYKALSYYRPRSCSSSLSEQVNPSQFREYYSNLFKCQSIHSELPELPDKTDDYLDKDFDYNELNLAIKQLAIQRKLQV